MKFCYVDESGMGSEPFAVMVGVIVDAQRMHVTKNDWQTLLDTLSKICDKEVKEFHTREFYKGNGIWRSIDGQMRSRIISAVLGWFKNRKHEVTFTSVIKGAFLADHKSDAKLKDLKSMWCFMGLHLMLTVQKHFQSKPKNKGNTVFVFDSEVREETRFGELVNNPPPWTNDYYGKKNKTPPLDQIIDVPYYGKSEDVRLIQVADLIAYLLRIYAELKENKRTASYPDEDKKLDSWIQKINSFSLPVGTRYPAKARNEATEIFYRYAPDSLCTIGR